MNTEMDLNIASQRPRPASKSSATADSAQLPMKTWIFKSFSESPNKI